MKRIDVPEANTNGVTKSVEVGSANRRIITDPGVITEAALVNGSPVTVRSTLEAILRTEVVTISAQTFTILPIL